MSKAAEMFLDYQQKSIELCTTIETLLNKKLDNTDPESVDFGHVGDIESVYEALVAIKYKLKG
jgi:acetylglutamate kinase